MRSVALLTCLSIQASAAPWQTLLAEASKLAYQQLPKDLLKEAGFPTPQELTCQALNNTNLEDKFASAICHLVPPKVADHPTEQACHAAVAFAWKQEAAEEKCPGAPKPWWPFHMLHVVANKLLCYELNKGDFHDKEKEITKNVCEELSKNELKLWACEAAMRQLWNRYEKDCESSPTGGLEELLPTKFQIDDIHV